MRAFSPATAAYTQNRGARHAHLLVWITALDRQTGDPHQLGVWTGADHREFVISGETRVYYGAGAMLKADPLTVRTGLSVRTQRLHFSQIAPELQQAVRGYDTRHQPIEMHRAFFDPLSELLVDEPHRVFSGFVDRLRINTPEEGGEGSIEMTVATVARALTKKLGRKRSHASLVTRTPGDTFRQYASLADKVEVKWGRG